jgi:mRNA interferase RelE/StbE
MKSEISFVPSADKDLDYYSAGERQNILEAVAKLLEFDADIEGLRRKRLRPNPLAPWELRIGDFRVFYEIRPGHGVRVLAVGHKRHNEVYIRGRRIVL